ncbi:hypothetical protein B0J14DRAFT_236103 [Halenospora varia]|nr:hypothetical protein B0J14DRAFT_236103 [Halenospora varia]
MFTPFSDSCLWALLLLTSAQIAVSCPGGHRKRDASADTTLKGWREDLWHPNNQTIHHRPASILPTTVKLDGITIQANTSACTAANSTIGKRDTSAAATSTKSTFLVIARDKASAYSAYSGLNDYGIPYELLIVPKTGISLPALTSPTMVGNYGGIVVLSEVSYEMSSGNWASALTDAQWNALYDYQINFGARMVRLDTLPSAATGTKVAGSCCADTQEQLVAINDTSAFPTAGLVKGATMSSSGLYHYPATIIDSRIATAFATFATTTGFSTTTVAGVINSFTGGRKQMVFFMPSATDWSLTSVVLQHAWIHWATRGIYAGYRRMMLNTQVDDMFLVTTLDTDTTFRVSTTDVATHIQWMGTVGAKMPSGSNYTIEIGHNGNGNIEAGYAVKKATCDNGPIKYADPPNTTLEYVKPPGTGTSLWPATASTYPYRAACVALDGLATFFQNTNNRDSFMHVSHTFTHENLNSATFDDVNKEITWNQNWLSMIGLSGAKWFSSKGLIPPAITGLHNGDALRGFAEGGIVNVVGDNTRSVLLNAQNEHWPLITTVEANGYDGIQITPRWASNIYFNCDTTDCDVAEWNSFGNTGDISTLLDLERRTNTRHLLSLHHDAFMFHQANMRWESVSRTVVNGVSQQLSLLQMWVETVVAEITRLVTWPIISLPHDVLAATFNRRATRDACSYQMVYGLTGQTITSVTVSAPSVGNKCAASIPVTVPGSVSGDRGFVSEKLGSDPLTVWVELKGKEVTLTLKDAVAW